MSEKSKKVRGLRIKGKDEAATLDGEIRNDATEKRIKVYHDTDGVDAAGEYELVSTDQTQTLTNKTHTDPVIDGDVSGTAIDTDVNLAADSDTKIPSQKAVKAYVDAGLDAQNEASEITYDNTTSGLTATNVQDAIDEVDANLDAHLVDTTDAHDASAISYDNTTSSLTATDTQSAIDEVEGRVDTLETESSDNATAISDHLADTTDAHDASAISYDNTSSGLTATDTQAAVDEVEGRVDTVETDLSTHIADTSTHGVTGDIVGTSDSQLITNKTILTSSIGSGVTLQKSLNHLASSDNQTGEITISNPRSLIYLQNAGLTGIEGIDGDSTINERVTLYNETGVTVSIRNEAAGATADTRIVTGTGADVSLPDKSMAVFQYVGSSTDRWTLITVSGAKSASDVEVTPAGSITSTDVQNALEELDTDITTHVAETSAHGVSGDVVGTTDAQVLTNKDIDGGTASNTNRVTLPKNSKVNLDGLTRKEGTVVYATDEGAAYIDNGTELIPVGSGSGSASLGLNLIDDASFEQELYVPTFSSVFATESYIDYTVDTGLYTPTNTKYMRVAMGGADTLTISDSKNHSSDLEGKQGVFSIWLKTSTTSDFKVGIVIDGVDPSEDLIDQLPVSDTGEWQKYELPFVFGTTSVGYKIFTPTSANHSIDIDNIYMGLAPDGYVSQVGDNITDWQEYDLQITGTVSDPSVGSTSINKARWRRVGDSMEIRYTVEQSGSGGADGSGSYLFSLPSGYSISSDKVDTVQTNPAFADMVGTCYVKNSTTNGDGTVYCYDNNNLAMQTDFGSNNTLTVGSSSFALGFDNDTGYSFSARVPIAGWSTGRTEVTTQRTELPVVKTSGNGGESLTANTTDIPFIELSDNTNSWDGSTFTAPESGEYLITGSVCITASSTGSIQEYINGSAGRYVGSEDGSAVIFRLSHTVTLNKNDVYSLRISQDRTLQNGLAGVHFLDIQKLPTNPQIVGKFAQIKSSETPVVRGAGNGGESITANVTDIPFTQIEDTAGAWDGSSFTAPADGYYLISGATRSSSNVTTAATSIFIDGGSGGTIRMGYVTGTDVMPFSGVAFLNKDQTASVRVSDSFTLSNVNTHTIHIQRIPDTESIVKNLAAEQAIVAARYTSNSGQSISGSGGSPSVFVYEDLDFDTHNAYNTSTGEYTVPLTGMYQINAGLVNSTSTSNTNIELYVNGSLKCHFQARPGSSINFLTARLSDVLSLNEGDILEVKAYANVSSTADTRPDRNNFSIARIK